MDGRGFDPNGLGYVIKTKGIIPFVPYEIICNLNDATPCGQARLFLQIYYLLVDRQNIYFIYRSVKQKALMR